MSKQPEFKKYLPLEEWFTNRPAAAEQVELTFDQVEAILGNPLPASTTKLATWWTNITLKSRVIAPPGSIMAGLWRNSTRKPGG